MISNAIPDGRLQTSNDYRFAPGLFLNHSAFFKKTADVNGSTFENLAWRMMKVSTIKRSHQYGLVYGLLMGFYIKLAGIIELWG
jgi:hypothetical protein